MNLFSEYKNIVVKRLKGRYITLENLEPILKQIDSKGWLGHLGKSEELRPIYSVNMGHGPTRVLGWSQMHGNESTTTKALFDFFSFLENDSIKGDLLERFTFQFIPMLNPDGAVRYTRENANGIDLNRDAQDLSQAESRVLRNAFDEFKPNLCLNLHDQRTIYGLPNKKPATVSFLAPAADNDLTITSSREIAMSEIARINEVLQGKIPGQIGRYDDSFNPSCVGDTFQAFGVPTILFEAGHFQEDYERERTREMIFYALWALFAGKKTSYNDKTAIEAYFEIPENQKNFRDMLLCNVRLNGKVMDIAIQYEEILEGKKVHFQPVIDAIGSLPELIGHKQIDLKGNEILINSHENVFVSEKIVTIYDKSSKKSIII